MNRPLFILMMVAGCTSNPNAPEVKPTEVRPPSATIEAKQVAAQLGTSNVVEIRFAKGEVSLLPESRRQIERLLLEAKKEGKIEKVDVIAWADEEFPSVNTKKLSQTQVDLAKKRADAISGVVRSLKISNIKIINMAMRSNVLQEYLQLESYEIQRTLEVNGIPNSDTNVKVPSKVGHAIIMVIAK